MAVDEVWLINGIPGVGKTTTARALAASLRRSAHIEGDRLHEMVVSGLVLPGDDPPEESEAQLELAVHNQCLLAVSFAQAGFVPVIDFVVANRSRLEYYRDQLSGLRLHFVTLNPGSAVALARDAARPEKTVASRWVHLSEIMCRELSGIGLWIDNGTITVEETVSQIIIKREDALL